MDCSSEQTSQTSQFPLYAKGNFSKRFPNIYEDSSIEFAVQNTSSVVLDLGNLKFDPNIRYEAHQHDQIALTPAKTKTSRYGPINILVTVNDTRQLIRLENVYGKALIVRELKVSETHKIHASLLQDIPQRTIDLKAILLEKGGSLVPLPQTVGQINLRPTAGRQSLDNATRTTSRPLGTIEVLTTKSLFGLWSIDRQNNSQHIVAWPDLVGHGFANIVVSVLPISNETCLSHLCLTQNSRAPQVKDIYFRAGSPGTDLHNRLWSSSSSKSAPTALLMMLGLRDVDVFLQRSNGTRHQASQFIEDFARSYSNLIQMIRRTAYSSSVAKTMQSFNYADHSQIDESYAYNSAPSGVPIFLVIPPFPFTDSGTKTRYVRTLISQMLRKVLNELKWHIGDRRTFIIDTAGWLEEQDFVLDAHSDLTLSQTGHTKFAYEMLLHLCHYLVDQHAQRNTPTCPFDRYEEYVGNLYVPQTASIGKLIEDKKVTRMKELFGIGGNRNQKK